MKLEIMLAGMLMAGASWGASAQTWDGAQGEPLMPGVAVISDLAEKALPSGAPAVTELSVQDVRAQGETVPEEQAASATWVSRSLFSKSEAMEYAEKAKREFERAGITVVSIGTYNNFESTGFFKHRAMVVYLGDHKTVKGYKSPWYKTKAERDQAMEQVSLQLSRQGFGVLDARDYREGDETGMFYVFTIDYVG